MHRLAHARIGGGLEPGLGNRYQRSVWHRFANIGDGQLYQRFVQQRYRSPIDGGGGWRKSGTYVVVGESGEQILFPVTGDGGYSHDVRDAFLVGNMAGGSAPRHDAFRMYVFVHANHRYADDWIRLS